MTRLAITIGAAALAIIVAWLAADAVVRTQQTLHQIEQGRAAW